MSITWPKGAEISLVSTLNLPFTNAVLVFSAHRWLPVTTYKLNGDLVPNNMQKHARRAKRTARPQKKLREDVQTWVSYIDSPLIFLTSSPSNIFQVRCFANELQIVGGPSGDFLRITSVTRIARCHRVPHCDCA